MKTKIEKPIPEFMDKFLVYLKKGEKKASDNTIIAYVGDLYYFCEWLKSYKNIDKIDLKILQNLTKDDMREWRYSLSISSSTESRKICCLKSLFKYLNEEVNLINNNVMVDVKTPKIEKNETAKYLPEKVAKSYKNIIQTTGSERDLAIISLFFNAGVRISELVNLNLDDLQGNFITVWKSKGKKSREVPIDKETIEIINKWLKVRPETSDKALFILSYFKDKEPYRITHKSVEHMIHKYAQILNIKVTPHMLRHTYGTSKRRAGVSLDTLKELMGHERVETTLIYAKITREEKEMVAELGTI